MSLPPTQETNREAHSERANERSPESRISRPTATNVSAQDVQHINTAERQQAGQTAAARAFVPPSEVHTGGVTFNASNPSRIADLTADHSPNGASNLTMNDLLDWAGKMHDSRPGGAPNQPPNGGSDRANAVPRLNEGGQPRANDGGQPRFSSNDNPQPQVADSHAPSQHALQAAVVQKGDGPYQAAERMLGHSASQSEKMALTRAMQAEYRDEINTNPQLQGRKADMSDLHVGHQLLNQNNFGSVMQHLRQQHPELADQIQAKLTGAGGQDFGENGTGIQGPRRQAGPGVQNFGAPSDTGNGVQGPHQQTGGYTPWRQTDNQTGGYTPWRQPDNQPVGTDQTNGRNNNQYEHTQNQPPFRRPQDAGDYGDQQQTPGANGEAPANFRMGIAQMAKRTAEANTVTSRNGVGECSKVPRLVMSALGVHMNDGSNIPGMAATDQARAFENLRSADGRPLFQKVDNPQPGDYGVRDWAHRLRHGKNLGDSLIVTNVDQHGRVYGVNGAGRHEFQVTTRGGYYNETHYYRPTEAFYEQAVQNASR